MNTFIKKFNTAVIYMFISYIARGNIFRVSQAKTILNHASDWSDGAFLFLICRHFKSSAGRIYVLWFDYLRLRVLWFFIFEYQLCASVSKNGKKYSKYGSLKCFWKHDMAASVFTCHFLSVSLTCLCLCMFVSEARFLYAFPPSWLMHLEAVVEAAVNSPVWNWMLPPCYLRPRTCSVDARLTAVVLFDSHFLCLRCSFELLVLFSFVQILLVLRFPEKMNSVTDHLCFFLTLERNLWISCLPPTSSHLK